MAEALALALVQALPTLIEGGEAAIATIKTTATAINGMVSENRDPTAAEIAAQDAAITAALDQLDAARAETDGPAAPVPAALGRLDPHDDGA